MIAMNASNDDTPERVGAACACPACGEREMDRLVWNEDEQVECITCGHVYDPESNAANGGVDGE